MTSVLAKRNTTNWYVRVERGERGLLEITYYESKQQ